MNHELDRDRGQRAQRLLEDDLYKEAFTTLETRLMSEWASSDATDTATRERVFLQIGLLKGLKAHLEGLMRTGDYARKEIERKRKK